MMIRRLLVLGAATALIMTMAGVVLAGGWAITIVDDAPDELQASTSYDITYTVLQHGRTPVEGEITSLDFNHPTLKEVLSFPGKATGEAGQYVATVELPEAGPWTWSAHQGQFGFYQLGVLDVAPSSAASGAATGSLGFVLLAATLLVGIVFIALLRGWVMRRPEVGASPSAG